MSNYDTVDLSDLDYGKHVKELYRIIEDRMQDTQLFIKRPYPHILKMRLDQFKTLWDDTGVEWSETITPSDKEFIVEIGGSTHVMEIEVEGIAKNEMVGIQ